MADDDRAVLRVVGPEDAAVEGGTAFTLKLRLDPHPDNGPPVAGDACFLDFAVAAQLSVSGDVGELSGTPALPRDVNFPATSFEDCTREATVDLSTRASDGEWMAPRTVAFALARKSGADERVDAGEGTVSVRDDTPPPGPLVMNIDISPKLPEATADYRPSRNREEFKEVPAEAVHGQGTVLEFTLTFDHAVTVAGGPPELVLDVFGRERRAMLTDPRTNPRTNTRTLTFEWKVAKGDNDPDGIAIVGTELNGATIRFAAGCPVEQGVTLPCDMDLPTFARDHGGPLPKQRVRGGFHTIALDVRHMEKSVQEGELYRIQVLREEGEEGAYDEHALAAVWMKDSAKERGRPIGIQFWPAGPHGIGREARDGRTAWVYVTVPGDGRADAERTLTFRLSGTDSGRNWYDPDGPAEQVVKVTDAGVPKGGPMLSVGPATVPEPATGTAALQFRVCLWPEDGCPPAPGQNPAFDAYEGVGHEVRVSYRTANGTARAGADYRATDGTLTFAPGETAKTVEVTVLADAHDEGVETVWLELYDPVGAGISARGRNVGDIRNDGPIPKAWIARFGRTVAEQVLEAVESRMRAAPVAGFEVSLAGERIGAGAASGQDAGGWREERDRREALRLADWLKGGAGPEEGRREDRTVSPHELLTGSSFMLGAGTAGQDMVSFWGRAAVSRFDGREGDLTLDGEAQTGMLGLDWTQGAGAGSRAAGLIVSHSRGEGGWSGRTGGETSGETGAPGISGEVEAALTGVFPWGRLGITDRLDAWGAAGYGAGDLTVTPKKPGTDEDGAAIRADLDLWMAAAGLRGTLMDGGGEGLTLTGKTDAMAVETSSGRGTGTDGGNLEPARATVSRLRLGVEASQPVALGGAVLTPSLEAGLRHDGGEAETGFGLDLGGGLALSDPARGLQAELRARGLLSHEAGGFRERGFSGSLAWAERPSSDRGAKLTLTRTVGGASSGGAEALFSRATLDGLSANDNGADGSGGGDLRSRRLEVKLGYGLSTFGDRFTLTPEVGLGLSDTGRDYTLAWRLARRPRNGGEGSLDLSFEARRRESANDPGSASHEAGFRLTARW